MTAMAERAAPRGRSLPLILCAGVPAIAAFANAAAYIAQAGNPLVSSDTWYFIEAFLRKAMEEGPSLQDFFVKRGGTDHAQPLVKALLWIDAKWWGLDFVYEALVGLAFAAAMFLVLAAATWRGARERQPPWLHGLALGALAACLVTLNSGMVFNWSLVTLIYMSYFLMAVGAAAAWRSLQARGLLALFAASLLIAFSFDDVGLIMVAALAIATLLGAARSGRLRTGVAASAVILAAEACYLLASRVLIDPQAAGFAPESGVMGSIQPLWAMRNEWPAIARIVLGSTFAHFNPLDYYLPESAATWQGVLAILAGMCHAWFWWRAWRAPWNAAVFHAVAIMLLFYGMVAGILYGRIPTYGVPYLNEPRYVAIYLLSTVALVLMVLGQPGKAAGTRFRVCACAGLALLLALQVSLSKFTWYEGGFLGGYYHRMASEMIQLGNGTVPAGCVPMLTVCDMPQNTRQDAIEFLRVHRMNVYSDEFLRRYRLEKLKTPAAEPARR